MYQPEEVAALYEAFKACKRYSPHALQIRRHLLLDKITSSRLVLNLLLEDALEEKTDTCLELFLEFCNHHQVDPFQHFDRLCNELVKAHLVQHFPRNLKLLLQGREVENIPELQDCIVQMFSKPWILASVYEQATLPPSFPKQHQGVIGLALSKGAFGAAHYLLEHGLPFTDLHRGMLWNKLGSNYEEHIIDLLRLFHQNQVPWGPNPKEEQLSMEKGFRQVLLAERFKILEVMMECGGYVNYQVTPNDLSLLHVATTQGNLRAAKWLINHGVDIDAIKEGENAAVNLICYHSNPGEESKMDEFFELLKSVSFDIETALQKASEKTPIPGRLYVQHTLTKWTSALDKEKLEKGLPTSQTQHSGLKTRI